jgi:hypothetical protein
VTAGVGGWAKVGGGGINSSERKYLTRGPRSVILSTMSTKKPLIKYILPLVIVAFFSNLDFSIARASGCSGGVDKDSAGCTWGAKNNEGGVSKTDSCSPKSNECWSVSSEDQAAPPEKDSTRNMNKCSSPSKCSGSVSAKDGKEGGNGVKAEGGYCGNSKVKPVGSAKPKCEAKAMGGLDTMDPATKTIVDSIINSKSVSEALAKAAERGTEFRVGWTIVDNSDANAALLQGIDSPLAGFVGKGKTLTFTLKLAKSNPRTERTGLNRIKGGAGIYPDIASDIRKALSEEVSKLNGILYEAAAYSKARLMGELELAALGDRVAYENIKVEAGTGEPEKLADARARALQAEIDVMDLDRKIQVLGNNFVMMTGRDHRSVTLSDYDKFLQLVPKDPDFDSMVKAEAMSTSSTDEAADDLQRKASDLLHQGGELMARRFVVEAATEALRKTRERMDGGSSNEAEEAAAKAFLLGSQKDELQALGEYSRAHCLAYPNVKFVVDTSTQPSISVSGDTASAAVEKPGVLWVAAIGLGILALVAYFGVAGRETDKQDPSIKP